MDTDATMTRTDARPSVAGLDANMTNGNNDNGANVATITRPTTRGDWHATVPVAAFATDDGNDASGPFATVIGDDDNATVRVRFGGRGGAMIAAIPDDARAAAIVASVRAMRNAPRTYVNDARPGAIPSTIVAIGIGVARNIRDGANVRDIIGRVPASRRTDAAPRIAAAAADQWNTTNPYATADADADADATAEPATA